MPGRAAALLTAFVLPALFACEEPGQEAGDGGVEEGTAGSAQMSETPSSPGPQGAQSALGALNDSGVEGEVEYSREDDMLTVSVRAVGLEAGEHASHIHQGTCQEPGGVVVPLESPTVEESDTTSVESQVDGGQFAAGEPYLVMVHGTDGAPVSCTEIPQVILGEGTERPVRSQ